MINLIQNKPEKILAAHSGDNRYCGQLTAPRAGSNVKDAVALGMPWAMDNDCFNKYDPTSIVRMLRKNQGVPNCLFMNTPDVVADHAGTLARFYQWEGIIHSYGYPVAFVLQDGVSIDTVPFKDCDAIFIGGTTEFKFSDTVAVICAETKRQGKWLHMGRVNSAKRIRHCEKLSCDSFDGTGFSRFMTSMTNRLTKEYCK